MNEASNLLQDIELAPAASNDHLLFIVIGLVALLTLLILIRLWYKRQHPINKAIRQLDKLPDDPVDPSQIAKILKQALQLKRLADSHLLPHEFIQRLDQARFSPTPCQAKTYLSLKREAKNLLQCTKEPLD